MKLPPKGLNNRLAALTGAVGRPMPGRPGKMYAVFEELSAGVAEQMRQLDEVIKNELPALATRWRRRMPGPSVGVSRTW